MTHHTGRDEGLDPWTDEVMRRVAPLLAGRDLRTGGAFVTACEEIADALRPVARDLAAAPDAMRAQMREFTQWVASCRAYNGSNHEHGQSLYNECLNGVLGAWAEEWIAERPTDGAGT